MNEKFSQINNKNNNIINANLAKATSNKNNENNDKYHDSIIKEYDIESPISNPGNLVLTVNSSRKLKARRSGKEKEEEETMNIPRQEPMFREEYFTFGRGIRAKASRLLYFKQFLNRKIDRQNFNNKGLDFLVNSKFVYVPFFIFTFLTLFDFGYTSFGLYLKYQPLIDTYYTMKIESRL